MAETESVADLLTSVNECEAALKQEFPQIRWIFFEPDVTD